MARQEDWDSAGVTEDTHIVLGEQELCKELGVSVRALYRLRRDGHLVIAAQDGHKRRYYNVSSLGYLRSKQIPVTENKSLIVIGDEIYQ